MLIDLGRNDVGRVSKTGSVAADREVCVERYSHVMHIVSRSKATCAMGSRTWMCCKATFPAGTVSGAPKIRAIEIIQRTRTVQAQHLRRRDRLHRLVRRCRHRDRDPHRGDPGRPATRSGRRRRRLRLRSVDRVGRNNEQGTRAVPRGGASGERALSHVARGFDITAPVTRTHRTTATCPRRRLPTVRRPSVRSR